MFIKGSKKQIIRRSRETEPHLLFTKSNFQSNFQFSRWVENLDGYNHFHNKGAIKEVFEKYLNWFDWDNESRSRAASALARISNFQFCVAFTTIVKSPFYLRGPTKKIQGRSLDLYNAVEQVMVPRDDLFLHGVMREKSFLHVVSNMHQKLLVF